MTSTTIANANDKAIFDSIVNDYFASQPVSSLNLRRTSSMGMPSSNFYSPNSDLPSGDPCISALTVEQ